MMIRKKTKTILPLLKTFLFLIVLLGYTQAFASDYNSDVFIKISNLKNSDAGLVTGYVNNNITFDAISFDINFLLNDDSYIYSLEDREYKIFPRGSVGISYNKDNYIVSFGLLDSVASKNFYNKLFLLPTYQFGVKALSRSNSDEKSYYTFTGSYIENNTALSVLYLRSFLDETLYTGFSVTPSMQYSLFPYRSIHYSENLSSVDGTIIYYNEYQGIGHGLDLSLRQYFNLQDSNDTARDISMGLALDYFGFSYKSHFLFGNNHFDLVNDESKDYKAFENSLYYTISSLTLGVYYLKANISTREFNYRTDMLELDLQYKFGENLILNSAIFYQSFKLDKRVLIALSLLL